ncbi:hypothetical protein [Pseudomonas sp. FP2309]|uniref:hypothetical protein n=1 Tax=Pseudomonas sp. FP2309 TaxID=2954091 RepID=UPI0027361BD1|nr:hypothetical protein [Pseudomonas sp. FP2309]WLH70869.1 hypothetical protein PSH59_12390 [Pseudomonas sp. FP2309]
MTTISRPPVAPVSFVPQVPEAPIIAVGGARDDTVPQHSSPTRPQRPLHDSRSLRAVLLDGLADPLREPQNRVQRHAAKAVGAGERFPTVAETSDADKKLQKNLNRWLRTGNPPDNAVPKKASIAPFIALYNAALKDSRLQAWVESKGFKPETVRVLDGAVVGIVVRDGKETFQRFSATDGSGWGQVSTQVSALQRILSPNNWGIPLGIGAAAANIPLIVLLDFYGVQAPRNEKAMALLGKQLKGNGWPSISQAQRDQWAAQLKQQRRCKEDGAVRERLSELLQPLLEGKEDNDPLDLNGLSVVVAPGASLDQLSKKNRERFQQFLASATFQAFLDKTGFQRLGAESGAHEYRLSAGDLQMRDRAGQWVSLLRAFEDEVGKVSRGGNADAQAAARQMGAELDRLVTLSKKTGDALYSTRTYDARQAMAHYALDVPQTVGQMRAALSGFNTQLPAPPPAGNYAGMTPYGAGLGDLPGAARHILKSASKQVMALFKAFSPDPSGFQSFPDPDSQLAAFFDSPGASALADTIAKSLKLFAVADGQALPRADRHQVLATALKFSVDAPVPGLPGTVAGYDLYQPANLGRTLKQVRSDVERRLIDKGVDPKVSALMAHLYLAQSAPEMLIKRDPGLPDDPLNPLNGDPLSIKVGSTAWMNVRLASAMAGDSRLNLQQALALARQAPTGPNHEALIKMMGAQAVLDWGVMAGIYPATSDRTYSSTDYEAASKAFTEREKTTRDAFEALTREPPTQRSLLVKQLASLFPEMTEQEIRAARLDLVTDEPYDPRNHAHLETRQPLLVDFILAGQAEDASFWLKLTASFNGLFKGDKTYNFNHPQISQATFFQRISRLPTITSLVQPAVDQYLADRRKAQATAMKLAFAELPLKQRTALESSNEIQFFTLRTGTGESLEHDKAPDSKVATKRGTHGLLMRYETGQATPKYGYYEVFPNSMKIIERTDLPDDLPLGDHITRGYEPTGLGGYSPIKVQKGVTLPYDFEAYRSGTVPRSGVSSEVIIEKYGRPLRGSGDKANPRAPNTFVSSTTAKLVDTLLAYSFDGKREALLDYANQPTRLERRRAYPFASGTPIFTAENARTVLSLIPFVGALADLVEGNTRAGVQGLLIDMASLIATGGWAGVKSFAKGAKILIRFNRTPFSMAALKGAGTFLRGVFNPLESLPEIVRAGPNALKTFARGRPFRLGSSTFLPVKTFEQWRWTVGAHDTLFAPSSASDSQWAGSRKGSIGHQQVHAIQKSGYWYAINPLTQRPEGTPLEQFIPQAN